MTDRPTNVGLVQINNGFSGQNYLPYSVGLLQAYAEHHLENPQDFNFLLPVYKKSPAAEAAKALQSADIVGFSVYVWNIKASLAIAKLLAEKTPGLFTIFGGPHVPDNAENFLRENPFIDVVCHGEGEEVFMHLMTAGKNGDWADTPGISFLDDRQDFQTNPKAARKRNLDDFPSPFLTGVFAPLMATETENAWIGLWETNRGCPFSCTFCDWGSATQAKLLKFDEQRLVREVDWFAEHRIEFIFTCDANFGIIPRDVELARYVSESKRKTGYPQALSVQNTKNATERAYLTQKILSDSGLNKGVALSLQSTSPLALKNIKRDNISLASYEELQKRFTRDGVETYSDLILSLPGETYQSFIEGVSTIMESGQHNRIQFNNLSILPNAEMGDPEYQKRFGMKLVETPTVNVHGSLQQEDEIIETQELVVCTDSMPPEAWVQTRSFAWMTAFLHFDKILQIPLIVTHEYCGADYGKLIETFLDADPEKWPLIGEIAEFFKAFARQLQAGGDEYVFSDEWLSIYWPADEYLFIKLVSENRIADFYREARDILGQFVASDDPATHRVLDDAIRINQAMLKLPFCDDVLEIDCGMDILKFHNNVLQGRVEYLAAEPASYRIDRSVDKWNEFDTWCREVVWYGNKKGAYFYRAEKSPGSPVGEVSVAPTEQLSAL